MATLEPPSKGVELVDSGTQDLDNAIEDHTSSSSGAPDPQPSQPVTDSPESEKPSSSTPGGLPIPKTVVEKVDPDSPSYGDIPGTVAFEKRRMDAEPDDVREAPEITRSNIEGSLTNITNISPRERLTESGMPTSSFNRYPDQAQHDTVLASSISQSNEEEHEAGRWQYQQSIEIKEEQSHRAPGSDRQEATSELEEEEEEGGEEEEGFGDDFDDFEVGDADEDFGAFDEGPLAAETSEMAGREADTPSKHQISSQGLVSGIAGPDVQHTCYTKIATFNQPLLDFDELDGLDDIALACQPYLHKIFPTLDEEEDVRDQELPHINPSFLSERSESLWAQLVAPPPLQPPDWVRSRIRRLFLVSLGVPVDLDEILPASKQKKLILPSLSLESDQSSGPGSSIPATEAGTKVPQSGISAAASHPQPSKSDRKQRGPAPPPDVDINSTRLLCSTTGVALASFSMEELRAHVSQLHELTQRASQVLDWWLLQKDSALGDKQAFEEVIENLVKHAQKIRK